MGSRLCKKNSKKRQNVFGKLIYSKSPLLHVCCIKLTLFYTTELIRITVLSLRFYFLACVHVQLYIFRALISRECSDAPRTTKHERLKK